MASKKELNERIKLLEKRVDELENDVKWLRKGGYAFSPPLIPLAPITCKA